MFHLVPLVIACSSAAPAPAGDPSPLASTPAPLAAPAPFHCGACGFNSGEAFIHTLPAESLPAGSWALSLRADQQEFDAFSDAELEAFVAQGIETHSLDRSYVVRAGAVVALSDTWSLGVDLPFVSNQGLREGVDNGGTPEVEDNGDQSGIGDAALFAQWKFFEDLESRQFVSLYFGAELPTGETHERASDGERLEADHQPGSGSTDALAGIAWSHARGPSTFGASAMYTLAGDGTQDSNLGDVLRVNAGFGWSPEHDGGGWHARWMLEFNGQWHEHSTEDGSRDPNSGGRQLFVSPGVRLNGPGATSWSLSIGVPLAQDLNGEQSETDWRATLGVGWTF